MIEEDDDDRRQSQRLPYETEIDVDIDPESMEATSIDISNTGIKFITPSPLKIDVRFTLEDKHRFHTGRLVWAKRRKDGGFVYAFEFIDENEEFKTLE